MADCNIDSSPAWRITSGIDKKKPQSAQKSAKQKIFLAFSAFSAVFSGASELRLHTEAEQPALQNRRRPIQRRAEVCTRESTTPELNAL